MEETEGLETVEIDSERFISLEFSRRWPKYVASWSVRRRSGDSDFPLADGEVEQLPPKGMSADDVREQLRATALQQAMEAAAQVEGQAGTAEGRGSLLRRLFRRT